MRYEFVCKKCKSRISKRMTIKEMEDTKGNTILCGCGGECRRAYSTTPIVVKGRGTYTVSYPNKDR